MKIKKWKYLSDLVILTKNLSCDNSTAIIDAKLLQYYNDCEQDVRLTLDANISISTNKITIKTQNAKFIEKLTIDDNDLQRIRKMIIANRDIQDVSVSVDIHLNYWCNMMLHESYFA